MPGPPCALVAMAEDEAGEPGVRDAEVVEDAGYHRDRRHRHSNGEHEQDGGVLLRRAAEGIERQLARESEAEDEKKRQRCGRR